MLLGTQFTLPFDADLPDSAVLLPRHPRLTVKPEHKAYPEILLRPIFALDRQPMMETMQGYSLMGTGIAGPLSTAIVETSGGRMTRVRPGDRLAGWQVASITENYLFFTRNKERRMLKLDLSRLYSAAKAAPPKKVGAR